MEVTIGWKNVKDVILNGNLAGDPSCQGCNSSQKMGQALMENQNAEGGSEGKGNNSQSQPDYSNIKDPKNPKEGGDFTKRQKREAREQNKQRNGGQMKSDGDGKPINTPVRTKAGGKRDPREAQLDHKTSKANRARRSSNIRVISAEENQKKGARSMP